MCEKSIWVSRFAKVGLGGNAPQYVSSIYSLYESVASQIVFTSQ